MRRRDFLRNATLAGAAGLAAVRPCRAAAEPPPETTKLRIHQGNNICAAPQVVAEALLRAEGFTDLEYIRGRGRGGPAGLIAGDIHMAVTGAAALVRRVDEGQPLVILAGSHVGCYELFATGYFRTNSRCAVTKQQKY